MTFIYLDNNATTPLAPEVAQAMMPYLTGGFGNPSSSHLYGAEAKMAVVKARRQVASMLGCASQEVIFTSGGTESDNYALIGTVMAQSPAKGRIITSAIEHPAVIETCSWLQKQGFDLTLLPVDEHGLVEPDDLLQAITDDTLIVSVMHANNEVGTLQPIADLARIAHAYGALMHTDAAQSIGKVHVNVDELGVDLLTVAGHKLYAPKGVGALYVRQGVKLAKLMHGAGHENGRRPGTENVIEIVGLGQAAELVERELVAHAAHMRTLCDQLQAGLWLELGHDRLRFNGHSGKRLPNTLSVSFRGVEANALVAEIGDRVAVSAGAACHADSIEISAVLQAMGLAQEWAMGTIRFSVGRYTTGDEISRAIPIVAQAVRDLWI